MLSAWKNTSWSIFIITIVIIWLIYVLFIRKLLSPLRKLPGPSSWSLIGNLGDIIREQPVDPYLRWCNQYGGVVRYNRLFGTYRVAVMDPDALRHILVTHNHRYTKPPKFRKNLQSLLGNGLVTSVGKEHAVQKKALLPAFKKCRINDMIAKFEMNTQLLINIWQDYIRAEKNEQNIEIDIHMDLSRLTMDIVCQCLFGYDTRLLLNPQDPLASAFHILMSGKCVTWTDLIPFYWHLPTKARAERQTALQIVKSKIDEIVEEKIIQSFIQDQDDMLSYLILLRNKQTNARFTKTELCDQVATFMLAGNETSSIGISWTLYALAKNHDIQDKVRKEIRQILKKNNYQISWDILDQLEYLNKVIKESLRLYSPAPSTNRICTEDDELNGYLIPKGTIVTLVAPHRWEKYYLDALTFNPDRWDNVANEGSCDYTFIPFMAGPRSCIGNKFAMIELKCVLALLLNKFKFDIIPGREVKRRLRVTMKPHPSLKLRVSRVR